MRMHALTKVYVLMPRATPEAAIGGARCGHSMDASLDMLPGTPPLVLRLMTCPHFVAQP